MNPNDLRQLKRMFRSAEKLMFELEGITDQLKKEKRWAEADDYEFMWKNQRSVALKMRDIIIEQSAKTRKKS